MLLMISVISIALIFVVVMLILWTRRGKKRVALLTAPVQNSFTSRLSALFRRPSSAESLLESLESLLLEADLGPRLTEDLISKLRQLPKDSQTPETFKAALKSELSTYLQASVSHESALQPLVILIVGVNGVGKTTTIAKLAHYWKSRGKRVITIAGDTFRAAAIDQLKVWGERVGFEVVAQTPGADPGAVVYDGLTAAKARKSEVVIIDTAGRLHTKKPLVDELSKIERVMAKFDATLPRQTLLVLDATTGQNGLAQAKVFSEAVKIDGAILTKWDGTAKGGVVFAIGKELGLPIAFIGVGEAMGDLKPFEPVAFVEALFE